jgi:hypothetical protein
MADKPAIAGGRPVRDRLLPLAGSSINEEDIRAVSEVLRGGQPGSGEMVKRFEEAVARYVGARYAVAVSSGAAGLHIGCGGRDHRNMQSSGLLPGKRNVSNITSPLRNS